MNLELLDFDVDALDPAQMRLRDGREHFEWPARAGDTSVTVLVERYAVRLRFEAREPPLRELPTQRLHRYRAKLAEHRTYVQDAARRKYRAGETEVALAVVDIGSSVITAYAHLQDHCQMA